MAKVFTARQIVNAMKRNGYKKVKGTFVTYDKNHNAIGGCVYGQAGLNLGVSGSTLSGAFDKFLGLVETAVGFTRPKPIRLNDNSDLTVPQIGTLVENWLVQHDVNLDRSRIQV